MEIGHSVLRFSCVKLARVEQGSLREQGGWIDKTSLFPVQESKFFFISKSMVGSRKENQQLNHYR